ncbi:MAG: hypothetical protein EP303_04125 [Deltaproteobacteria bacterium]|nr:MAG: hypothetical protein EP303_04125 [Deltaproteobacteria bacterium]
MRLASFPSTTSSGVKLVGSQRREPRSATSAERLRRLPERERIPLVDGREILMVHGSPADNNREISHDLSDDEILALLDDDPADIIVCGSTHVPFQRTVEEYHVVNVGSAR